MFIFVPLAVPVFEKQPTNFNMSFRQYLASAERRELYKRHPQRNSLGPISERLKQVSHADVCNWAQTYNGGIIPAVLQGA